MIKERRRLSSEPPKKLRGFYYDEKPLKNQKYEVFNGKFNKNTVTSIHDTKNTTGYYTAIPVEFIKAVERWSKRDKKGVSIKAIILLMYLCQQTEIEYKTRPNFDGVLRFSIGHFKANVGGMDGTKTVETCIYQLYESGLLQVFSGGGITSKRYYVVNMWLAQNVLIRFLEEKKTSKK